MNHAKIWTPSLKTPLSHRLRQPFYPNCSVNVSACTESRTTPGVNGEEEWRQGALGPTDYNARPRKQGISAGEYQLGIWMSRPVLVDMTPAERLREIRSGCYCWI